MRIDKFLKNSRIIKRRTIAKEACQQGKVSINEKIAKPGDGVEIGDIIQVQFGTNVMKYKVLKVDDNVRKDQANELYQSID